MNLERALEKIEELEKDKATLKKVVSTMCKACKEYDYNDCQYEDFLLSIYAYASIADEIV